MIAAKEFPRCYEGFIKIILENLQQATDPDTIDTYLRIITDVLNEADDTFGVMTNEILPIVLNVFKTSTVNFVLIHI